MHGINWWKFLVLVLDILLVCECKQRNQVVSRYLLDDRHAAFVKSVKIVRLELLRWRILGHSIRSVIPQPMLRLQLNLKWKVELNLLRSANVEFSLKINYLHLFVLSKWRNSEGTVNGAVKTYSRPTGCYDIL